jgi:hypothetical protein
LPASPALAASMVALRASRLVCSAIEVMTFTTSPISADGAWWSPPGELRRCRPVGPVLLTVSDRRMLRARGGHGR